MHIHADRGGRDGFTLIELLVVVGVIAILMGILIPVLGTAKAAARKASTKSTMTTVINAIQAFRTDNRRNPSYVSVIDLASSNNDSGITQMQSALFDLMGGVISTADPIPAGHENHIVDVSIPTNSGTRDIRVDILGLGSPDGPGYLDAKALIGSPDPTDKETPTPQPGDAGVGDIPEILDGWGRPIALWLRNEAAGTNAVFADEDSGTANAMFYWRVNRPYFMSRRMVGDSLLRSGSRVGRPEHKTTLEALLGHPAFPNTSTTPIEPAAPKADVILHSCGKSEIFLERPSENIKQLYYQPDPASGQFGFDENVFSDILSAGG